MYKEWADGQISKLKNILNSARQDHTSAVQTRIESVKELGGVVDITKNLFAVSKVCHTDFEPNNVFVNVGSRSEPGDRAAGSQSF
jgi:Ser/Thr protein kinase RdoA (MazF antagonist)